MRKILLFIVLIPFCCGATAQEKWTLRQCVEYALAHNIGVKQLEISCAIAENAVQTSKYSRLPDLNAGVGQNFNFGRGETSTGLYEVQTQSNTNFSFSSSVPLFTGFRLPNELARNRLDLQAATLNLQKAKDDLALTVASLYLQVLFTKELLTVASQQEMLVKTQVERTKTLVEAGRAPAAQLSDIRAQEANEVLATVQAQNNLRLALLDLAQGLEIEDFSTFDIVEPDLKGAMDETLFSPADIYETALALKPVIKARETQIESAEKNLKIAQSGYYPTLTLGMSAGTGYYYNYDLQGLNRTLADQLKNNLGEALGLTLNVPIFNRLQTRSAVKNAVLNIKNAEFELENAKKTLFKEIQTACLNAAAAQEKFHAAELAAAASLEALQSTDDKYAAGKATAFELGEARAKWTQSQSNSIQAKYDYIFRSKILDFYQGKEIVF